MGGTPPPAGTCLAPGSLSHVHGLSLNIRLRAASVPSLHVLELTKARASLRHAQLQAGPRGRPGGYVHFSPKSEQLVLGPREPSLTLQSGSLWVCGPSFLQGVREVGWALLFPQPHP